MSLRELARRVDVSASLVSQIETGRMRPSVPTLHAIVAELGLSLDEIREIVESAGVSAAAWAHSRAAPAPGRTRRAGAAPQHRADQRRVIELGTGVTWERVTAWTDPDVEFMIVVYQPGGGSSADGKLMRHSGREFGLVLSGTLSVTVGFDDHLLGPGDSISFQSTTPHRLRNDGTVEVRAIWVALECHGLEAGIADSRSPAAVRSSGHRRAG
jgi:mannose-6-phosphate isomerase-like protein (cupin superfamily)/DNA-binding XRE family transcriptional regulator